MDSQLHVSRYQPERYAYGSQKIISFIPISNSLHVHLIAFFNTSSVCGLKRINAVQFEYFVLNTKKVAKSVAAC